MSAIDKNEPRLPPSPTAARPVAKPLVVKPLIEKAYVPLAPERREQIVKRLRELLLQVDEPLPLEIEKILNQSLVKEEEISRRLAEIVEQQGSAQPHRQLHEMGLYLTLLSHHAEGEEKEPLSTLASRVKHASSQLTERSAPLWKSHLEKLERAILKQDLLLPPSQLTTHQGTAIDPKTFAHIHAEALIKGTSFEGNADGVVISYLRQYLEHNKSPPVLKMVRDAETLTLAARFDDKCDKKEDFAERSRAFRNVLNPIIEELKPGEKTLIPSGWTALNGGHSMKIGVERQPDGKLRLLIYNLGEGIQ